MPTFRPIFTNTIEIGLVQRNTWDEIVMNVDVLRRNRHVLGLLIVLVGIGVLVTAIVLSLDPLAVVLTAVAMLFFDIGRRIFIAS